MWTNLVIQAGDTDKGGEAPAIQPQETAFVGMNGEVTSNKFIIIMLFMKYNAKTKKWLIIQK